MTLEGLYNKLFPRELLLEHLLQNVSTSSKYSLFTSSSRACLVDQAIVRLIINNNLSILFMPLLSFWHHASQISHNAYNAIKKDSLTIALKAAKQRLCYEKTIRALVEDRIDFTIMKTYPLAFRLFNQWPVKTMRDLDVLVPVSSYKKTAGLLKRLGFAYIPDPEEKNRTQPALRGKYYLHKEQENFVKNGCTIEVHTSIVGFYDFFFYALNSERIKKITHELSLHTEKVSVGKISVKVFAPTALLISLFLHAFLQHNFRQVMSYYETSRVLLVSEHDIKWKYIFSFVERHGLTSYFLWFLSLCNTLYPDVLSMHTKQRLHKYENNMGYVQRIVWYYSRYRLFHPEGWILNRVHLEKKLVWAIIGNKLLFLVFNEFHRRIFGKYIDS